MIYRIDDEIDYGINDGIDNDPEIFPLNENKFEMPYVGTFEVDLDNQRVKFFRKKDDLIGSMISALSSPDILGIAKAFSEAKGPFLISKRFARRGLSGSAVSTSTRTSSP